MKTTHEQIKQVASFLIIMIWVVGFIALYFLAADLQADHSNSNLPALSSKTFRGSVGLNVPDKSFDNEGINSELRPVQHIRPNQEIKTGRFEFSSKNSFLKYFENQFPVNDLLAQYDAAIARAGSGSTPEKIVVESVPSRKGEAFNENFKVSVRFSIKPVPQ